MGIYDSGNIFGIRIYNFNDDDFANTLYEQKYNVTMSYTEKKEAYLFYTNLSNKNNIFFKIYTECTSTYEINNNVIIPRNVIIVINRVSSIIILLLI